MLIKTALNIASPNGPRSKLTILIFHRVLPTPDALLPGEPDAVRFENIIKWLKQWFNIIPLTEAIEKMKTGNLPARSAAITFDDGYADNLTHAAPILLKHQAHATFFISTGFIDGGIMWNDAIIETIRRTRTPILDCSFLNIGSIPLETPSEKVAASKQLITTIKYLPLEDRPLITATLAEKCGVSLPTDLMLTSSETRELRSTGMSIGAHTVSHPILTTLDDRTARNEIALGAAQLSEIIGERIGLFAYPNGKHLQDYTMRDVEIVKSLGFDGAVTTDWGVSDKDTCQYQLRRFTPWDNQRSRFGLRLFGNLINSPQNING